MQLFVNLEFNGNDTFVLGVYSTKENAQQALVGSIREHMENCPEGAPFSQSVTDKGILIRSAQGLDTTFNIVERTLDE